MTADAAPDAGHGASGYFTDRHDAGRRLAARFSSAGDETGSSPADEPGRTPAREADRPVVVGLPRGGVPVAAEVASAIGADLDVALVHKLGAPYQPEFAIGAIADGGSPIYDERSIRRLRVSDRELIEIERRTRTELASRARRLRRRYPEIPVEGRPVIIVDDGSATGMTAHAACRMLRAKSPASIVMALPVASAQAMAVLEPCCDGIVCVLVPEEFVSVGQWYDDFAQTSDVDVLRLLGIDA